MLLGLVDLFLQVLVFLRIDLAGLLELCLAVLKLLELFPCLVSLLLQGCELLLPCVVVVFCLGRLFRGLLQGLQAL